MRYDAVIIAPGDTVATVLRAARPGESIRIMRAETIFELSVLEEIPAGHKVAVTDMAAGEPVVKYGETIGTATAFIPTGGHTHVQNVESRRGRGDVPQR